MSPTAHRTGLRAHGVLQGWVGLLLPPRAQSGEHHVTAPHAMEHAATRTKQQALCMHHSTALRLSGEETGWKSLPYRLGVLDF